MEMTTLKLAAGLLLLIAANIVLGSADAIIGGQFDKTKCWRGALKGLFIFIAFIMTYGAGYLNPQIVVVAIDGKSVDLLAAVVLIIIAGYAWYAKEVLVKLAGIVRAKVAIEELPKK